MVRDRIKVLYEASNIVISMDRKESIIHCNWIGDQEEAELKAAGEKIFSLFIEANKEYGCTRILNDNREVTGEWYHSVDWANNDWFPRMIAAGLMQFAWVCPRDVFSQLSAKRAFPESTVVRTFFEYEEAMGWLNK